MARYYKGSTYQGFPINNKEQNLIPKRLEACYQIILSSLFQHRSTIQTHYTLRLPLGFELEMSDTEIFNRFIKKLNKYWDKKKRGKLHYVWCKEIETSKHCHWHIHLLVDEKFNQRWGVTEIVKKAWCSALQPQNYTNGLVHIEASKYGLIDRTDPESVEHAMYWLSYLCKVRKGTENHGFGTTRTTTNIQRAA